MKYHSVARYLFASIQLLLLGTVSGCFGRSNRTSAPSEQQEERKAAEELVKRELKAPIAAAAKELQAAFQKLHESQSDLGNNLKGILEKTLTPEKYDALKQTNEYKNLMAAYEGFAASAYSTELSIDDVQGKAGIDVNKIYDEIIAYKKSPAGADYRAKKQRSDAAEKAYVEKMEEIVQKLSNRSLLLNNGHQVDIRVNRAAKLVYFFSPDLSDTENGLASFFDKLPADKKALFTGAPDLEAQKDKLDKELSDLRRILWNDDAGLFSRHKSYHMPFDTTVDEDIQNREALFQTVQKIKEAEAAFLALGKD